MLIPSPAPTLPSLLTHNVLSTTKRTGALNITGSMPRTRFLHSKLHPGWELGAGCVAYKDLVCLESGKMTVSQQALLGSSPQVLSWLPCSHHHQPTHHPLSLRKPTGPLSLLLTARLCVSFFAYLLRNSGEKPGPQAPRPKSS